MTEQRQEGSARRSGDACRSEKNEAFSVNSHPSEMLLSPTLLEASAGTGKTFSIKHLVLRFIVEHNKQIDRILVVTFTRAATAELSTRIREHLNETVRYTEACRRVAESLKNCETGLSDSAEKAVARDLVGAARTAGLETEPFEALTNETDSLIVDQVRRWAEMTTVSETREGERVPLSFDLQLTRLRRALSNFDNAAIYTIHSFCRQMLDTRAFSASGALEWELVPDDADFRRQAIADFLRRELFRALPDAQHRRQLVDEVKWDSILSAVSAMPAGLVSREIKGDRLCEERRRFLDEVPAALQKLKADAGVAVYDDLLITMWKTIECEKQQPAGERAFIRSVREAYQAVLIDEFQDTDPLQYEIFKSLFLPEDPEDWKNGALFFVGDPKQAIYSFRSADLETYFKAREDLIELNRAEGKRARRTVIAHLPMNYRSSPALVASVNAFFSYTTPMPGAQPKRAFLNPKLDFVPVGFKQGKTGLFLWTDGHWQAMDPFVLRAGDTFDRAEDGVKAEIDAVTADMVALVRGGQEGRVALRAENFEEGRGLGDGRPSFVMADETHRVPLRALEPRDMAILVRGVKNNDALDALRRSLEAHGIRTRLNDDSHICATPEAEELLCVLHAYAAPDDERIVRAARVTRLIGETLDDLEREDDARRTRLRLFFEEGRRQWTRRGLAAILGDLMARFQTAERLLPVKGGEQALTNFSHLIEILHEAGKTYNAPSGLIAWFESVMRTLPGGGDERWQVRLASDANLVTVWTIHKSKGLQYPVVYLPFSKNLRQKASADTVQRVHRDGRTVLEIWADQAQESPEHAAEAAEENIRLAYVALTRAACRIMMTASYPATVAKGRGAKPEDCAYWQLLMGEPASSCRWDDVKARLREMAEKGLLTLDDLQVLTDLEGNPIPSIPRVKAVTDEAAPVLAPSLSVRSDWGVSSFSKLTRQLSDDDNVKTVYSARYRADLTGDAPTMLDFPRGAGAGTTLHRILELADFQRLASETEDEARRVLAERVIREKMPAFESEKALRNAVAVAADMIDDVLNAEILPSVRLRDISPEARMAEMEFLLSMPEGLTARHLSDWLARQDAKYAVPALDNETLSGFLTGFVDLVFRDGRGRFWVLDWKSNAIVEAVRSQADYTEAVMAEEMTKHHYRLQYLLYLVALRRFLKKRLGDLFRDEMIGGAVYVFLRGVKKTARRTPEGTLQGVTVDRVPATVLESLDTLFSDRWKDLVEEKEQC